MVEDFGSFLHNYLQEISPTLKVWCQYFHGSFWEVPSDCPYGFHEMPRTLIWQVVARHRRYDHMPQAHLSGCTGYVLWLRGIERRRSAHFDCTETAVPCAYVAHYHERSSSTGPALTQIGTSRTLAYRM